MKLKLGKWLLLSLLAVVLLLPYQRSFGMPEPEYLYLDSE